MSTSRILFIAICLAAFSQCLFAEQFKAPKGPEPTPENIAKKIESLGLRDDTLTYHERPGVWLKKNFEKSLSQLIAALDNSQPRIADASLKLLDGIEDSKEFENALLRIATDKNHPIYTNAILTLCNYTQLSGAQEILAQASDDATRFPHLQTRVKLANASGNKAKAVKLQIEYHQIKDDKYYTERTIKKLGQIGHSSAIEFLLEKSKDQDWGIARFSYLSLAMIDSTQYGLTEDQQIFLKESHQSFKATRSGYIARWEKLSQLNKQQIRPFVMQLLHYKRPEPAITILQIWRDKQAIPQIKQLIQTSNRLSCGIYMAAYMDLEGTDRSISECIELLTGDTMDPEMVINFRIKHVIRQISYSIMSNERKLQILQKFRDAIGPQPISKSFYARHEGNDEILSTLMNQETDINALGNYAQKTIRDHDKRFASEVRNALEKLASHETFSKDDNYGATLILQAVEAYKLQDAGILTDKLMDEKYDPDIQLAAAAISANYGGDRQKALKLLYKSLSETVPHKLKNNTELVAKVECKNKSEIIERENIILDHLGKQTETHTLRLLTTCPGKKSQAKLLPILDSEDIQKAIYAAWILAQYPDEKIRTKAIRRLAIYAIFNHHLYQQGSGIDFKISENLRFHQLTNSLNPGAYKNRKPEPVVIPDELLRLFAFDKQEQTFSIRAYRQTSIGHISLGLGNDGFSGRWCHRSDGWDKSHLPLLNTIVTEDLLIRIIHINGNEIPHFANRKSAAEVIAKITSKNAAYKGLAGEFIIHDKTPITPYEDQTKLLASYILDHLQPIVDNMNPFPPSNRKSFSTLKIDTKNLTRRHGPKLAEPLRTELINQSKQRGIANQLKATNLKLWRNIE